MDNLQTILQGLSQEEQAAVIKILTEQSQTGSSVSYSNLIGADYDEIPVSIQEFIESPKYARNYIQTYYPFWKEQLINIFDKGKHYSEIAFTGSIGTGKSSMAIVGMAYELYKLMCLKNPQKYWGTNKTIFFAFFNNNLDLARSVGFAAFHDLVKKSEWFLDHGEFRGKVHQVYHPYKDIELMAGSLPSHVIGKDVFCLTGDTKIFTESGVKSLYDLEGKQIKVLTTDGKQVFYSHYPALVSRTGEVSELIEIELEDGTILKCTPNHKFLTTKGVYKCAEDLTLSDELDEGNWLKWYSIDFWTNRFKVESVNNLKRYIRFMSNIFYSNRIISGYAEHHHIIPVSLINNSITVKLTAREHFIAHNLLARALGGNLWYAVHMMLNAARNNPNYKSNHNYSVSSRLYELVRCECAKLSKDKGISDNLLLASKTYNNSMRGTEVINNGLQDKRVFPEELEFYLSNGWVIGSKSKGNKHKLSDEGRKNLSASTRKRMSNREVSKETREKLRLANLGKTISEEQKRKISEKRKGVCNMSKEELNRRSKMFSGSGNPNYGKIGANVGKICIFKDAVGKYIYENELDKYIEEGWKRGRPPGSKHNLKLSKRQFIYGFNSLQFDSVNALTNYLQTHGYPTISTSSVSNLCKGSIVKKYEELMYQVYRRKLQ